MQISAFTMCFMAPKGGLLPWQSEWPGTVHVHELPEALLPSGPENSDGKVTPSAIENPEKWDLKNFKAPKLLKTSCSVCFPI